MHGLPQPVIQTERLELFVPSPKDAARMCRYVVENREHLKGWEPERPARYFTEAYWKSELATAAKEFRAGHSLRLVLVEKQCASGPIVGTSNFRNFVWGAFRACHLGYSLDNRFQGRGLMREALKTVLDYVFGELGLHRVMAAYMPHNERSARLLKSLGFESEGYARDYLLLDGAWRDHVLTSKLNPEEGPKAFARIG
jgi:[ribosomal protein S5]-alanine N-acetyltransferase